MTPDVSNVKIIFILELFHFSSVHKSHQLNVKHDWWEKANILDSTGVSSFSLTNAVWKFECERFFYLLFFFSLWYMLVFWWDCILCNFSETLQCSLELQSLWGCWRWSITINLTANMVCDYLSIFLCGMQLLLMTVFTSNYTVLVVFKQPLRILWAVC